MRRRVLAVAAVAVALPVQPAQAMTDPSAVPACDGPCAKRVQKREARQRWRRAVRDYGTGLLHARMLCESGSSGGYALATTGNSYWFSMQFNVGAWVGAGGRVRGGRPVGVWSTQPTALEQQARAVFWDRKHPGDPWPNCP